MRPTLPDYQFLTLPLAFEVLVKPNRRYPSTGIFNKIYIHILVLRGLKNLFHQQEFEKSCPLPHGLATRPALFSS